MAHLGRNARIRASHEHLYLSLCLLGNYGPQQAQLFMCVTVGNCCNTGITVRKFSVRSYERYLFAKSLSKLILCTHTRSAVELILWHSDTWIYLIPQFRESLARIPWAWNKGMGVLLPCPHYKALTRDNKVFSGQICHSFRRHQLVPFTSESCLLCSAQMIGQNAAHCLFFSVFNTCVFQAG